MPVPREDVEWPSSDQTNLAVSDQPETLFVGRDQASPAIVPAAPNVTASRARRADGSDAAAVASTPRPGSPAARDSGSQFGTSLHAHTTTRAAPPTASTSTPRPYSLPPESRPAHREAEIAGLIDSLLRTWRVWARQIGDSSQRFAATAADFKKQHATLIETRCDPPEPSYFPDLIADWQEGLDMNREFYNILLEKTTLPAARYLIVASYFGSGVNLPADSVHLQHFVSPIDELARDLNKLGLTGMLTMDNLRAHSNLFGIAAKLIDGEIRRSSVSSLHSSDLSSDACANPEHDDAPRTPPHLTSFIYSEGFTTTVKKVVREEQRHFLTETQTDEVQQAHVIPRRPRGMHLAYAMKGLALDASGAFDVGFGINDATNSKLRGMRADKDLIAIVPNRTFLIKVLKHVDAAARKKELQNALTSPEALRDVLSTLAKPSNLADLEYTVYALQPSRLADDFLTIPGKPLATRPSSTRRVVETYVAIADGLFRSVTDDTPLLPRTFTRSSIQVSPIAFAFNTALKVLLPKGDFKIPPEAELDVLLCVSIFYHILRNPQPHADAMTTALEAASLQFMRAHRGKKRKWDRGGY